MQLDQPHIDPQQWLINPDITFLNHGSFGACPRVILNAQREVQEALERDPVAFMIRSLSERLNRSRERLSVFLKADSEGLAFVSNASEGVATALDSISWVAGDEVIISQDAYPACRHMITELAQRYALKIRVAKPPFALDYEDSYEEWSRAVIEAFRDQASPRTRLLLIDHITSPTALIYPVSELVALARDLQALSLVDGAHAPGQLDLALDELQADFYVGNLHKWVFTPKSCAFIYTAPSHRLTLKPRVISHGYLASPDRRYHALFDWTGTRDYSAACVLPEALDWVEVHGGWSALRDRNHTLICEARDFLIRELWGGSPPPLPPRRAIGHLAAIPLPDDLASLELKTPDSQDLISSASAQALHPVQNALRGADFEVPVIATPQRVLLRISAQAYNTRLHYQALAGALSALRSLSTNSSKSLR